MKPLVASAIGIGSPAASRIASKSLVTALDLLIAVLRNSRSGSGPHYMGLSGFRDVVLTLQDIALSRFGGITHDLQCLAW